MRNWIDLLESAVVEWAEMTGHELRERMMADEENFEFRFVKGSNLKDEKHLTAWAGTRLVADAELTQSPYDPDEAWFMHAAVAPGYQGRGFGAVLCKWAFRTARAMGKKTLTISSFTEEGQERLNDLLRKLAVEYDDLDVHFNSDGPRRRVVHEGYTGVLSPTDENIARATAFVLKKWRERAAERGQVEPKDLSSSCKFTSMFAQAIFGGTLRGNWAHQYIVVDDKIIDLNRDAEDVKGKDVYHHDSKWWGNAEHNASIRSCEDRVKLWVEEFRSLRESVEALDFKAYLTITDSYKGEAFGYCQAHIGDSPIGYLNFSIYQGEADVKMIEVNEKYRRKGVAKKLLDLLAAEVGGKQNINWGYHTEDGQALHTAYDADI